MNNTEESTTAAAPDADETQNIKLTLSPEAMRVARRLQRINPALTLDEIASLLADQMLTDAGHQEENFIGILEECATRAGREPWYEQVVDAKQAAALTA